MEAARPNWTDSRLDDLNERVSGIAEDVRHQSDRIDKLQHTITVGGGLIAAMLTLVAAMLGTMITLLLTHL